MDITTNLKELGFSERETKVYLSSLQLGESGVYAVAEKADLPRMTTQYILTKLKERGLVEIVSKGSRRVYIPYPPRKVLTLLKHQREKLDEEIVTFEESLPELNRLLSSSVFEPKVRFFRGQEEIRQIYEEILTSFINEAWYVGPTAKINEILGESYMRRWVRRRKETGIKSKAIRVREDEVKEDIFTSEKYLRSVRYAPEGFTSPGHVLIYGDNVGLITTPQENFGLVTTSREYAEIMRSWFKELWKVSSEK